MSRSEKFRSDGLYHNQDSGLAKACTFSHFLSYLKSFGIMRNSSIYKNSLSFFCIEKLLNGGYGYSAW